MKHELLTAGILTFHRADNYGALLQTLALLHVLEDKGVNAEIIDYRCESIEKVYHYGIIPQFRLNILAWGKQFIKNCIRVPKLNEKKKKCEGFRENLLKMSSSVKTRYDRENSERKYDLIFTGSDQIWNPRITRGKDDWFKLYVCDLNQYDLISVRESSTETFLKRKLVIPVYHVLDPTLLVSAEWWNKITPPCNVKPGTYVFYYDVDFNSTCEKIAKKVAQINHLKIVHFNIRLIWHNNMIYAESSGPEEFLSYIKNAACVVTSSFHATVFSVLFDKFLFAVPHPKTGSRIIDLLKDLGLEDRVYKQFIDTDNWTIKPVCNKAAIDQLNRLRGASLAYLDQCIKMAIKRNAEK